MSPLISPRENAHDTEKTYNSTPPASVQTAAKTEISESQAETGKLAVSLHLMNSGY